MTPDPGNSEFGEVFFTDVVVPDADRLGPEGRGWSVGDQHAHAGALRGAAA